MKRKLGLALFLCIMCSAPAFGIVIGPTAAELQTHEDAQEAYMDASGVGSGAGDTRAIGLELKATAFAVKDECAALIALHGLSGDLLNDGNLLMYDGLMIEDHADDHVLLAGPDYLEAMGFFNAGELCWDAWQWTGACWNYNYAIPWFGLAEVGYTCAAADYSAANAKYEAAIDEWNRLLCDLNFMGEGEP